MISLRRRISGGEFSKRSLPINNDTIIETRMTGREIHRYSCNTGLNPNPLTISSKHVAFASSAHQAAAFNVSTQNPDLHFKFNDMAHYCDFCCEFYSDLEHLFNIWYQDIARY